MFVLAVRLVVLSLILVVSSLAHAADIPITGLKLIVLDKLATASKAKAVFVAKDGAVTKGAGTDPAQIEATLDIAYDSVSGAFLMPPGGKWLVNSTSVAKYVDKTAPTTGAVKVSVIKPGSLVKVVGKSLGDTPLDISSPPSGAVYVVDTIVNDGETTRLCTQFAGCVHKVIAGGTGYKLICKGSSSGDAGCLAATTTSTSTSSSTTTTLQSGCFQDWGDGTIRDTCTGLQWEQKDTAVLSGPDPGNPHDVDNQYSWAGLCSIATSKPCQPNLAAETACKAQTDVAHWGSGCEQCGGGEGTCAVGSFVTVWDWLAQVNAANYAGHDDWRLPSEDGRNTSPSTDPRELETILLAPYICGTSPCVDLIFGPTGSNGYWSSSTSTSVPLSAWEVHFLDGSVNWFNKATSPLWVRAVRGGS